MQHTAITAGTAVKPSWAENSLPEYDDVVSELFDEAFDSEEAATGFYSEADAQTSPFNPDEREQFYTEFTLAGILTEGGIYISRDDLAANGMNVEAVDEYVTDKRAGW